MRVGTLEAAGRMKYKTPLLRLNTGRLNIMEDLSPQVPCIAAHDVKKDLPVFYSVSHYYRLIDTIDGRECQYLNPGEYTGSRHWQLLGYRANVMIASTGGWFMRLGWFSFLTAVSLVYKDSVSIIRR